MKDINISLSGLDLSFRMAGKIAAAVAGEIDGAEPVLVAWHDKDKARMSPTIEGGDIHSRWRDYGESHGGQVEVDVNGDYDFIFAAGEGFEGLGRSPYVNVRGASGEEYVCQLSALHDPKHPTEEACVKLEDTGERGG
ncbi:MAG: AF1514 family protein [Betaproteobacteria bacterium]|nr:AF1514 family protein [Betaproteobacteria bacterium]